MARHLSQSNSVVDGEDFELITLVPAPSAPANAAPPRPSLLHDLLMLLLKIALVTVLGAALLTFVFGLYRVNDDYMQPSVKSGDVVMFYRLDHEYLAGDVLVLQYNGRLTCSRVIAVAGDEVGIDSEGLLVNGAYQQEQGITDDTTQVADGVTFPLTVPEGSVFLLGDHRMSAVDSRIYGCVPEEDIWGKMMGQFRWRGF